MLLALHDVLVSKHMSLTHGLGSWINYSAIGGLLTSVAAPVVTRSLAGIKSNAFRLISRHSAGSVERQNRGHNVSAGVSINS